MRALDAADWATDEDYQGLIQSYVPGYAERGGAGELLTGRVAGKDLADYLINGKPPSVRTTTIPRGPAQQRQIGALAEQVRGSKGDLAAAQTEARSLRRELDKAVAKGDQDTTKLSAAYDQATARVEELRGKSEQATQRAATGRTFAQPNEAELEGQRLWRRRGGAASSPGERATFTAGKLKRSAEFRRAASDRLDRRMSVLSESVGGTRDELSRSLQERVKTDINTPTIKGYSALARRSGPELGDLVKGTEGATSLSGELGRIARAHGVAEEVAATLEVRGEKAPGVLSAADRGKVLSEALDRAGVTLEGPEAQRFGDAVGRGTLEEDIASTTGHDAANNLTLNTPRRVADLVNSHQWMPDDLKSQWADRSAKYEARRTGYLRKTLQDQERAMPARFRTIAHGAARGHDARHGRGDEPGARRFG